MSDTEYKFLVAGMIILVLLNLLLLAWVGTGRCVSSPACICREVETLCWDQ